MTQEQFKLVFDQHFDAIRRYLYFRSGNSTISTDLAQDTFMKVWERGKELDPERDAALLYKIASDLFISHLRRVRISREVFNEIEFEITSDSPESEMQYKELQSAYKRALGKLPDKQRTAFMMSRMEHLTYREIAERLSLSVKTVEKRVSAALIILRIEIKS
ncbi:MAG: sigma-70 family RNA polymerase sigma factor [Bacteroidetes bacterium]|nr:sigma-70 family RNA polymerase sigma factor [Bacteroidota bacterium]